MKAMNTLRLSTRVFILLRMFHFASQPRKSNPPHSKHSDSQIRLKKDWKLTSRASAECQNPKKHICGSVEPSIISRVIYTTCFFDFRHKKIFFGGMLRINRIFNVFSIWFHEKNRWNLRNLRKHIFFASGDYFVSKKSGELTTLSHRLFFLIFFGGIAGENRVFNVF